MIKPYYSDSMVEIYHGDCREIIPALTDEIKTVITDPVWPNCPEGLMQGFENPQELLEQTLELLQLLTRLVIVLRGDSDPRFLKAVPDRIKFFRVQILPYVIPGYIGRKLGGEELAYCFGEPIPSRQGQHLIPGRAPLVQPGEREPNGHPCSRALKHMSFIVRWWNDGEIILDPFCGSGTILRAAKDLEIKSIGIEIEEKYCELAAKRMRQEVFEFDEERHCETAAKRMGQEVLDYV